MQKLLEKHFSLICLSQASLQNTAPLTHLQNRGAQSSSKYQVSSSQGTQLHSCQQDSLAVSEILVLTQILDVLKEAFSTDYGRPNTLFCIAIYIPLFLSYYHKEGTFLLPTYTHNPFMNFHKLLASVFFSNKLQKTVHCIKSIPSYFQIGCTSSLCSLTIKKAGTDHFSLQFCATMFTLQEIKGQFCPN